LLPNRLYSLSKILVKICRHTATEDYGIAPTDLGWLPAAQVLQNLNFTMFKGKGKGAGGTWKKRWRKRPGLPGPVYNGGGNRDRPPR